MNTIISRDGYNYNFYIPTPHTEEMISYAKMAKRFMNKPFNSPLDIVGNYQWHENLPYETYLFQDESGKELKPYDSRVVDFGCGPGRMIPRAKNFFKTVDGIDISEYAIEYAREHQKGSTFFVSSGIDVGDAPINTYDLIYSTICIQHIPVRTIRKNILAGFKSLLKDGGIVSIQVAYNENMQAGVWSADTEHANYESDFFNAKATNGHADMVINKDSIKTLEADFSELFKDVSTRLYQVDDKYGNLNGAYHAPYWATHWLFIRGTK
jgi:SAM-dependent methyltransferase